MPLDTNDLQVALNLVQEVSNLKMGDAVHAATALNHNIKIVISPDRDFDLVEGLTRVDPADKVAVEQLISS